MADPFILLDDARSADASDARLYRHAREWIVAHRHEEVAGALERLRQLSRSGCELAGFIAYEAGLAMEGRLAPIAASRSGAAGPLLLFGAFDRYETIAADQVPHWLAANCAASDASLGPLEPQLSPGGYAKAFARLQAAIRAGDIYQVNLTLPIEGAWAGDAVALYAAIRPRAAAGYGGIVFDGGHWLLSFSPELFFALKNGDVTVKPMKGTRPRGTDAAQDRALASELARSEKDRAENLMIVDLMRNDLSRVAQAGSVSVAAPFAVESYPTVHQMVSTVRARLAPEHDAVDVLRALFPCGSITGAPKIRAMELIAEVERDPRGPYCGSIGRIDASGDAAFNVAIRTLRLTPGENGRGRAVLGVGSAIVADSEALPEWRECMVKGDFVRQSGQDTGAAGFDLIETMVFIPDDGIALLELHLERIRASAADLGFRFDRHAVRNAIQALCFEAEEPARLRLVASGGGQFSLELSDMPPPLPDPAPCVLMRLPVDPGDLRLRHKTSDRGFYDAGLAAARKAGAAEAIFVRDDGLVTEGCFTSVFVRREGGLVTPPLGIGLLPGVLRRSLIESGEAREGEIGTDDLAGGFLIGNAVRGLVPARLAS
ncbi:aminodeoxychorismate synthase, component I [Novosphingobium marinum]|uniref:Probable branched-chain-amino-acid aminotransferase n=1 Tax=Novosphingobium marinum TaxID=1514948 RepID=A0A7Z0BU27_9SPHN|nr:aminodeoxychorismate synthase component I [Novosphingobium marinum]NYH94728.1 para-aminobenzoate synthetase/4-amino-4-deoxychorismate lyase [Novosphingobium marinum]GGC37799.1 aminodeoxychorismate synthase, component I [Novosphingobium marinum]